MPRRPALFGKSEDGSIAVMSSLSLVCVISCLALAVDFGSLYLERRHLQSMADLSAIAALSSPANPQDAVSTLLAANGVDAVAEVETGTFTPDPLLQPSERYAAGGASRNAARVTLTAPGNLYFARVVYGGALPTIRVRATAAEQNVASFSIGSRLASLNGGILNELFGDFLDTTVSLTVMDYNGLAGADLDLLRFIEALAGEAGITAGTYESVLQSALTFGDVIDAAATVAGAGGAGAAQVALNKLKAGASSLSLGGPGLLDLGSLGDLAIGERPAGFAGTISALDLARAAVNAAGPNNQAQISLSAGLPGIASVTVSAVIGEPPQGASWITLGPEGAEVYTAQTRVRAVVTLLPATVAGKLVTIQVPLALDIAAGRATLETISCGTNPSSDARVELAARPAIGGLYVGEPRNFADWTSFKPADIQGAEVVNLLGLLKVSLSAAAPVSNNQDISVWFDMQDIQNRTIRIVQTANPLSSLIASVFSSLNVQATALGLEILVGPLLAPAEDAVRALVQPVGALVEPILQAVLDSLGVGLGEADLRVYGVRCGAPALVM